MNATTRNAFRQIGAAVRENLHAGRITIAGTNYDCAKISSSVRNELTESGWRKVQTAVVLVHKRWLATCPTYGSEITMDSLSWFLVEAGGQDAEQPAWKLTIKRHLPDPS